MGEGGGDTVLCTHTSILRPSHHKPDPSQPCAHCFPSPPFFCLATCLGAARFSVSSTVDGHHLHNLEQASQDGLGRAPAAPGTVWPASPASPMVSISLCRRSTFQKPVVIHIHILDPRLSFFKLQVSLSALQLHTNIYVTGARHYL